MTRRYAPPGLSLDEELPGAHLMPALPADKNRGVEVVVRCDFGAPVEREALLLFSDEVLVVESVREPETRTEPVQRPATETTDRAWAQDVNLFN